MKWITRIALCIFLFGWMQVISQGSKILPRHLTIDETEILKEGSYIPPVVEDRTPFRSNTQFRAMAEWEELQAIAITWRSFPSILAEIVRYAVDEVKVIIFYQSSNVSLSAIKSYLSDRGIDPEFSIEYIPAPSNSIWIRDYGANPVYINDVDTLAFVDWIYNRPRFKDDLIPVYTAEHLSAPLYSTTIVPNDLVHTGGNFMSDGLGNGFSSMLVLDENGPMNVFGSSTHDEKDVDRIMQNFMGIRTFPKMTNLPFDRIHHIDMHMKLLDEETLLVGEYPAGTADGPQIEANLQALISEFETAYGRPFKVQRILMPPDQFGRYPHEGGFYRTYTNALFVNKTILVPVYEAKYDTTALRVWEDLMPGYRIVGIDCNEIIPSSGALHCITKEIGVEHPLLITHRQPRSVIAGELVDFTVQAQHFSGISDVDLYVKYPNDLIFEHFDMQPDSSDHWVSTAQFDEDGVYQYYFHATATNGKDMVRPIVAPEGTFKLEVSIQTTSFKEGLQDHPDVLIYPNPASDQIFLSYSSDVQVEDISVNIMDLSGTLIRNLQMPEQINFKWKIDLGDLPKGIYLVRILSKSGVEQMKISLQ